MYIFLLVVKYGHPDFRATTRVRAFARMMRRDVVAWQWVEGKPRPRASSTAVSILLDRRARY